MANSKKKLDRIDLDELFDSPVNRGMLSFLQRPPEEARERLREKEMVDRLDSNRLNRPQGESPSGPDKEGVCKPPSAEPASQITTSTVIDTDRVNYPVSTSLYGVTHPLGKSPAPPQQSVDIAGVRENISSGIYPDDGVTHPLVKSPIGVINPLINPRIGAIHPLGESNETSVYGGGKIAQPLERQPNHPLGEIPSGSVSTDQPFDSAITKEDANRLAGGQPHHPLGEIPSGSVSTDQPFDSAITKEDANRLAGGQPHHPLGDLPTGYLSLGLRANRASNSPQGTKIIEPGSPEVFDGKIVGRRQKIRRAVVAQDGHSSGEQLLYQSLWNAANLETQESRVLSVGYKGMSMLCKLDHSNCKKNIHNLIEKLAVEIIDSYDRATSTGTTYRLFSYKEILRRRESAGLLWVIRANGVKFVNATNAMGKSPTAPPGNLHSGPIRNLPFASLGESRRGPVGKPPGPPLGEPHTQLGRENNTSSNQSSSSVHVLLQKQLPTFDHGIIDKLWARCRAQVPDVTEAEVSNLFDAKMSFAFERGVVNPNGFLLTAVAASCTRAAIDAMRRGRELAEPEQEPDVTQTRQEQIANYESYLKALPNHPAAKLWRSKLDELREGN
jgi:hypothetical protein